MNKVPFTETAVKDYLDKAIRAWRLRRDARPTGSKFAIFYIDAYQSVRTSLFGETLDE